MQLKNYLFQTTDLYRACESTLCLHTRMPYITNNLWMKICIHNLLDAVKKWDGLVH